MIPDPEGERKWRFLYFIGGFMSFAAVAGWIAAKQDERVGRVEAKVTLLEKERDENRDLMRELLKRLIKKEGEK
jgi:hypothetical protein